MTEDALDRLLESLFHNNKDNKGQPASALYKTLTM
eukprot:CAMPEP_0116937874 /NCGR_PEP_ID=MMETSP0467-20121206/31762_1 /TAXON_ID=283647 /ORGANISM="Mesodinium pulex, Strain SPMC105" /LENGTH=34 /DNA_ID= /DNA_START= /DNA_END= /DNA_ORIENTATION=